MMRKIIKFVKKFESYSRPNSLISYIDNILAIFIFGAIKKIKWLSPNRLTTFSLILWLIAVFGYFFWSWELLFILLAVLSYTFDNIDGIWARYFNQTSNFGAWYDSFCDRIKDTIIMSIFALSFRDSYLFIFFIIILALLQAFFIIEFYASKYLVPRPLSKNLNFHQKKIRMLAFGPAEATVLYSSIIILPVAYKIIPVLIFCLAMIFIIFKVITSYEFNKQA